MNSREKPAKKTKKSRSPKKNTTAWSEKYKKVGTGSRKFLKFNKSITQLLRKLYEINYLIIEGCVICIFILSIYNGREK